MIRIQATPIFLKNGAIVPTKDELEATIHALIEERDRVMRGHGDRYSKMSIQELDVYIAQLQQYQKERG